MYKIEIIGYSDRHLLRTGKHEKLDILITSCENGVLVVVGGGGRVSFFTSRVK